MAKKVTKKDDYKEHYENLGKLPSIEVQTPYPEKKKETVINGVTVELNEWDDIKFVGSELVKLSERLNELERTFNDLSLRLDRIAKRMGL